MSYENPLKFVLDILTSLCKAAAAFARVGIW